jgi:hypothetical protein
MNSFSVGKRVSLALAARASASDGILSFKMSLFPMAASIRLKDYGTTKWRGANTWVELIRLESIKVWPRLRVHIR